MTETTEPSRTTTMKAVVQHEYGSADVLQFEDIARPTACSDELLVHVRAASVGAWDWHDMMATRM